MEVEFPCLWIGNRRNVLVVLVCCLTGFLFITNVYYPPSEKDPLEWSRKIFASVGGSPLELGISPLIVSQVLNLQTDPCLFSLYTPIIALLQTLATVPGFSFPVFYMSGVVLPFLSQQIHVHLCDSNWNVEQIFALALFIGQTIMHYRLDDWIYWVSLPRLVYILVLLYLMKLHIQVQVSDPNESTLKPMRKDHMDISVPPVPLLTKQSSLVSPRTVHCIASIMWALYAVGIGSGVTDWLRCYGDHCNVAHRLSNILHVTLICAWLSESCIQGVSTGLLVLAGDLLGLNGMAWVALVPILDQIVSVCYGMWRSYSAVSKLRKEDGTIYINEGGKTMD